MVLCTICLSRYGANSRQFSSCQLPQPPVFLQSGHRFICHFLLPLTRKGPRTSTYGWQTALRNLVFIWSGFRVSGFSYPGEIFVSAVTTVALTICPCCCSCTAFECRRCWLCTVLSHPTDLSSAPRILTASGTVLYLCRVVNTLVII